MAALNNDRITGIVDRLSNAEKLEDIMWMLDEPVKVYTQSIVDDFVEENVDFHAKSGLHPKIERKLFGDSCEWCRNLAGTYDYGDHPPDIYRRHEYCRCKVLYDPGNGKLHNVHTKKWVDSTYDSRAEARKVIGLKANGVTINGVSEHVFYRMENRDVDIEDIKDAINNPLKVTPIKYDELNSPSFQLIGEKATIAINPDNGIITTTHHTHTKLVEKLRKGR